MDFLTSAKAEAPPWLGAYDQVWISLSLFVGPTVIPYVVAIFESVTAFGLLAGYRVLRVLAPLGFVLAFLIWSVPEEFGGPYRLGVGAGPLHMFGTAVIYMVALGYIMVVYNPLDMVSAT